MRRLSTVAAFSTSSKGGLLHREVRRELHAIQTHCRRSAAS